MAVNAYWYSNAFKTAFQKEWNWSGGSIKVMMTTSTYNAATGKTTHLYKTSVTNEVTGTGYTAGGSIIATGSTGGTPSVSGTVCTLSYNTGSGTTTWASATITGARYAVIYDNTPATDATRPLIAYVDFGGDQTTSGGDFSIVWNASGIAQVSVA